MLLYHIVCLIAITHKPVHGHRHHPRRAAVSKPPSMTVYDLWLAYRDNSIRGNALYQGKRVLLKGYVAAVEASSPSSIDDDILVTLQGGDSFEIVICRFANTKRNRHDLLNADGHIITILGSVGGKDIDPWMDHCIVTAQSR